VDVLSFGTRKELAPRAAVTATATATARAAAGRETGEDVRVDAQPSAAGGTGGTGAAGGAISAETNAAFDAFARARTAGLLRFGYVLTGDRDRAADLVQDALERALLAWPRIINRDDPEAYVRRIMVNRHVSIWRRTRRERLVAETPDTTFEPTDPHDAWLWSELATLPARQRAVLVLRFYEDLGAAQTAEVLGCSVGTVKSTTSRGLARLRERISQDRSQDTEGVGP
jgi:RNA polymerase sigma-70 factor (sigma-E family)